MTRTDAETIQLLTRNLVLTTWTLAQNVKNNLKRAEFPADQIDFEVRNNPVVAQACDALKTVLSDDFDPLEKQP